MKKVIYINFLALLLICAWLCVDCCLASVNKLNVQQDQLKANVLVEKLHISEALGPLAPVALSPFFGLTCLSATSILCNHGLLPENTFLMGNDTLNNVLIFASFLGLTVITSVPRLVTASKIFAEATERLETYAGIISYGVILMLAEQTGAQQQQVVYTAGIFTFTHQGLLACAAAVNIFVVSTVRCFFELLTLISPIPTLDAIFEFANKSIAALLALIYAFNPWLAFVINVIIFLICLAIFKWVKRRIRYLRAMLLDPMLLGLKRSIFNKEYIPDSRAKNKMSKHIPGIELLVKCFPMRRFGKIKKKDLCYLIFIANRVSLVKPRFLKAPLIKDLDSSQVSKEVKEGLIGYLIEIADTDKHKSCELVFGGAYTKTLDAVKAKLGALK